MYSNSYCPTEVYIKVRVPNLKLDISAMMLIDQLLPDVKDRTPSQLLQDMRDVCRQTGLSDKTIVNCWRHKLPSAVCTGMVGVEASIEDIAKGSDQFLQSLAESDLSPTVSHFRKFIVNYLWQKGQATNNLQIVKINEMLPDKGDRSPSQLLQDVRGFCKQNDLTIHCALKFWLQKLPSVISTGIAELEPMIVDDLAELADRYVKQCAQSNISLTCSDFKEFVKNEILQRKKALYYINTLMPGNMVYQYQLPSNVLRDIQAIWPTGLSDELLRYCWLQKLPNKVRLFIEWKTGSIESIAELADTFDYKIDIGPSKYFSTLGRPASFSNAHKSYQSRIRKLENTVKALKTQVASLESMTRDACKCEHPCTYEASQNN